MFTADLCGMWWLYCIHKPRIHPFIYQFPFFIDFNFKWQRRRQQRLLLATTTENKQIESPRCLDTFPMQPDRLVNHFRLFFLTTTYIFRKEANKREIPEAKSRFEHIFGNENGERIRVNANTFYDTLHEKAIKVGEKKSFIHMINKIVCVWQWNCKLLKMGFKILYIGIWLYINARIHGQALIRRDSVSRVAARFYF